MAERKFTKGCPEWLMFQEYYQLVQKYYLPESNDKYLEESVDAFRDFAKKYKNIPLAKHLGVAFSGYVEAVLKGDL